MSQSARVDQQVNGAQTSRVIELSEQAIIDQMVARLASRYPTVAASTVSNLVHDIHSRYDDRPVRDFVPLLVERNAKAELSRLGAVSV
jgi:hypothetical protein